MSTDDKIIINEKLSTMINKLMLLVESYPDLKANKNFNELSDELIKVEDEIANSRKYYNDVVRLFNNKVEMFSSNVFAKIFGYKSKPMYETSVDERDNIKVKL